MRIWTVSDLHQEFTREPKYAADPATRFDLGEHVPADADVCVIAGDLDVNLSASLRRIARELPEREVIYVAGNHDYWNVGETAAHTMDEILDEGRELAVQLGIHFLENDSIELHGVRFIGATLWTDMQSVGRGHQASKIAEARGRDGMNDYKRMKRWSSMHPGKRKAATPEMTIKMHEQSRAYIERTLADVVAAPTVVVTHHAPHPGSLDDRHKGKLDWCYASNLDLLLRDENAPDLWLHGHIHAAKDYEVAYTRVVANPRGYCFGQNNDLGNGFQPGLLIEIDGYEPKPPGL